MEIRERIQADLERLDRGTFLFKVLHRMRVLSQLFLTFRCIGYDQPILVSSCSVCPQIGEGCADKLLFYRLGMGFQIAEVCIAYEIDIGQALQPILPVGDGLRQTYGVESCTRVTREYFHDDIVALIRSIQRAEGNFECCGTAVSGYCDQFDCAWRIYCLEGF